MDTIGIKVKSQTAACIKVLRKHTELAVSQIKARIENGDFVYECDYVDTDGIQKAVSLYNALCEIGVEAQIFEQGEASDVVLLGNLLNSHKEIEAEIEKKIAAELGESEWNS